MVFLMRSFTAICLAQAAGLNPALPVLIVSVIAASGGIFISHGLTAPVLLPKELMFVTTWWGLAIIIAINVIEFTGDKIQGLDNVKHSFIDPFVSVLSSVFLTVSVMGEPMGELLKSGKETIGSLPAGICMAGILGPNSYFWAGMIIFCLAGVFITLFFLMVKTLIRYFMSLIPDMGISNIFASFIEDCIVVVNVILAVFIPVLGVVVTIALGVIAFFTAREIKKRIAGFFKNKAEAAV